MKWAGVVAPMSGPGAWALARYLDGGADMIGCAGPRRWIGREASSSERERESAQVPAPPGGVAAPSRAMKGCFEDQRYLNPCAAVLPLSSYLHKPVGVRPRATTNQT